MQLRESLTMVIRFIQNGIPFHEAAFLSSQWCPIYSSLIKVSDNTNLRILPATPPLLSCSLEGEGVGRAVEGKKRAINTFDRVSYVFLITGFEIYRVNTVIFLK